LSNAEAKRRRRARSYSIFLTGRSCLGPACRRSSNDARRYDAARTFSIGNAPDGSRVELTIELFAGGAVSPYLVNTVAVGDTIEVMGPIGGWFV
jgi:NADPH-dependent ferric siderophore reductase